MSAIGEAGVAAVEERLQAALRASRRREREIAALLDGCRTVLEYREFADAARALFDSCKMLLGAPAGYVALLSNDGTQNDVVFLEAGGQPCTVDPSLPMPVRGLRAEAYRAGKAVYHNDFSNSEWMELMPEGHVRLENVLFAPLAIDGKTVGLLGLANKPGGFTVNDARLATAFGELAAMALRNSRTFGSLEHSEQRYRSLAQTARDGIVTVDEHGNIVHWNPAAEALFGYPADEIVGAPLTAVIPERFREAHRNGIERVASGERQRSSERRSSWSG